MSIDPLNLLKRGEKAAGDENAILEAEHDQNLTDTENAVNSKLALVYAGILDSTDAGLTLVRHSIYIVDATGVSGALAFTLPASPDGSHIVLIDADQVAGTWSTTSFPRLTPASGLVFGQSVLDLDHPVGSVHLVRVNSNWMLAGIMAAGFGITMTAAEIQAALEGPVNTTSGTSYTFILADAFSYRRFTSATAVTATVPTNASVPFVVGTVITIRQAAAGAVTLTPAGGVTLNPSFEGTLVTAGQGATISLKKIGTDAWDVVGQTVGA